jgi:hypothetical protein
VVDQFEGGLTSSVSRRELFFLPSAAFAMIDLVTLAETTDLVCVAEEVGVTTRDLPQVGADIEDCVCFM